MKKYKNYLILLIIIVSFLVGVCFIPVGISKFIPIIEQQVEADLGIKIHLDKLILRVGPSIKIKSPIVHIMYSDGRKFAQIDNVKFYISWASMLKDTVKINNLNAKKITVRINSDDKEFFELIDKIKDKEFSNSPNIKLKEYNITYNNKEYSEKYVLEGHVLELDKILKFKNYKIKTNGSFFIDNQKYLSYDINCLPLLEIQDKKYDVDIPVIVKQLKELGFYSDIIADVKIYKSKADAIQASGFINIDNMSVLDPLKKNPKSFVYLTLWGDKASVLSNIYTSPAKKIYLEGMVNNSKKPILDFKVKTDDINLQDLHQKLKILTAFSVLKNINTLSGNLNADFTIKGDLNKIKSTGFLKIDNASLKASGIEIEKITSEIDFSNNAVNIIKTIGYVNNSPILVKGKFDKEIDIEVLMNKVALKNLTPSIFGIKSGVASVVANIKGPITNIVHKEKIQIDNLNIENKDLDLSIESFNIDTNKNNTAYVSNIQGKTNYTTLIKIPSLKLFIDGNTIKMPETNIFMQNSMLSAKAEVNDYNKDLAFNTVISGYVNSKDITKYNNYSTRYPLNVIINGNKSIQNINSQVLIENSSIFGEPTVVNLISKYEKNSLKIEDLSLVGYSGKNFNDNKTISKLPKKITITGVIDNIKSPIMKNIRIFIPQQLNLNLYDTILHLKGDLFINGSLKKPDIIGQLLIQNLINQNIQLTISNSTFDFNKNNVIFSAPTLTLADTSLGLNAIISTDISNGLIINGLNVKSKYLNTDTILMYKDSPLFNNIPIIIKNAKVYIERVFSNVYSSQLYLTALNTDLELIDEILRLKNLNAEMYNGKLAGTIEFNLRDEHFKSDLMGRAISAAPIFDIISTKKESISGTMDFDSKIEGNLTSKQSLCGDIKFIVNNGRMSTLGKLEHLLYAQNVIADNMLRTSLSVVTKAITLKDTGLFKYLRGDVTLNDGIAYINMLQTQGPLMSLFIKGQYNPINDYAQLTVLGRLSDEVIVGLGAFADFSFKKLLVMLTGEDNKYSILPEDFDKIPQLPIKNTKEFRTIINGIIDKPSSVILFNWIAYSQKSLKQKEVPITDTKIPDFVDKLPY